MSQILRDRVYTYFLGFTLFNILCIDLLPHYPKSLYQSPSSPLHPLHLLRKTYAQTLQDPFLLTSYSSSPPPSPSYAVFPPPWFELFTLLEAVFQLPATIALLVMFTGEGRNTSGELELACLVYAMEYALSTLVCLWDVLFWERSVLEKGVFIGGIYGPFFFIPAFMAADMYIRLLRRIRNTNAVAKKTQ